MSLHQEIRTQPKSQVTTYPAETARPIEEKGNTGRAWYAVILFGALYVVAFIDRMILGLLVEPLKAVLHISDTQMSLLIGFNFAVFYSLVGIPLGRLADRGNRRNLILASTVIWTICTLASGFATSFLMLCLLRLGVAIGESALSPSVMSLIGDMFPREKRAAPTTVYMCLGAFGATASYIFGGVIVRILERYPLVLPHIGQVEPWRAVFFAVAAPALLLTILAFTVREPARRSEDGTGEQTAMFAWTERRWRPLIFLFIAGATVQAITIGLSSWAPTFLVRRFGWDVGNAGMALGCCTMIFGLSGMMVTPTLTEKWTRSGRLDALPLVLLTGTIVGTLGAMGVAFAPNPYIFIAFYGLSALGVMGTGLLLMVAIHLIGLPRMRAELMAVALILNSLIAMGCGPSLVTFFSGILGHGALQSGFAGIALLCGPLSAIFILMARSGFAKLLQEADGAHR